MLGVRPFRSIIRRVRITHGIALRWILLRVKQSMGRQPPFRCAKHGAPGTRPQLTGQNIARTASGRPKGFVRTVFRGAGRGAIAVALSASGIAQQQPRPEPPTETERQLLIEFSQSSSSELVTKYFERPPYPLFVIRRLIELADPVVVPALRIAFEQEPSPLIRQFLAATLFRLGDSDSSYFDYLARAALGAATSDLPYHDRVSLSTAADDVLRQHGEILAWAHAQGVTPLEAIRKAMIELPAAIQALGEAADRRSLPILLRGLDSLNVLVVREAAFGLARLHDRTAVQPIIEACRRLAPEERLLVAKSLLYFDSRTALKAAASMILDPERVHRWREEVRHKGWGAAMRD